MPGEVCRLVVHEPVWFWLLSWPSISAGLPSCAHIQYGMQHGILLFPGKTAGMVSWLDWLLYWRCSGTCVRLGKIAGNCCVHFWTWDEGIVDGFGGNSEVVCPHIVVRSECECLGYDGSVSPFLLRMCGIVFRALFSASLHRLDARRVGGKLFFLESIVSLAHIYTQG